VSGIAPPQKVQELPGLHVGDIVETATGEVIGIDHLVARLSNVTVVYVGEVHTSVQDHKIQLDILEKLSQCGQHPELGMEMFPVSAQPILDKYLRGEMTEDQFLQDVGWKEIWGFPYQLYRPLINFQKEKHMPVLGLNAPHQVVRKIAHTGLSSLSPEERSQVAREFHLDDPRNRLRIRKDFAVHGKNAIKDFDSFFEAQAAWEETMAQTLAERLTKTDCKCKIVVAVGQGHMTDRLGVPYLTFIRKPCEYRTIVPLPIDYPESVVDHGLADYVIITDKSESPHPPALGVIIRPAASGRGIEILQVAPGSPAAVADLRKGDIIVSIDGSNVKSAEEIKRLMARGGPHHKIAVERNKQPITISVTVEH
jgi:uncharacterized iron-regulated protein